MNHELTSMTNTIMTLKIRLGKPLYDIGLGLRYILPSSSWKLHCNETWPSFQPVGRYFRSSLFILFSLSSSSSFVLLESLDSRARAATMETLSLAKDLQRTEKLRCRCWKYQSSTVFPSFAVVPSAIMISSTLFIACVVLSHIQTIE